MAPQPVDPAAGQHRGGAGGPVQGLELQTNVHTKVRNHGEGPYPTRAFSWLIVPTNSALVGGFSVIRNFRADSRLKL